MKIYYFYFRMNKKIKEIYSNYIYSNLLKINKNLPYLHKNRQIIFHHIYIKKLFHFPSSINLIKVDKS